MTPRAVLPKCESPDLPSARTRYRVPDTESRSVGRKLNTILELNTRPRIVREQEVAVEIDVVAERRDVRAGCDAEPGLDHAAEHHAQVERACRVRHAHRFADPARLRELDVDAAPDLGAPRDRVERVAVLVDVDRDRRAALELDSLVRSGGKRLLAVLDVHLREVLERLVKRPVLVHVDL